MDRFNNAALAVAIGLGLSLAAGTCDAGQTDIRLGTFSTNWCGFSAKITLEKQTPNKFKGVVRSFEGTIHLERTNQVDTITVQQLADGHLHMVRSLSGSHAGKSQVMVTHPPEILARDDGKFRVNFAAKRTEGYGAKLLGFFRMTVK